MVLERLHQFFSKKSNPSEARQDKYVGLKRLEPELKEAQGAMCVLTYNANEGKKFVLVTIHREDLHPTKSERIQNKIHFLFLGPGMYSFPGGAVDGDEDPIVTVEREIGEELQLTLDKDRIKKIDHESFPIEQSTSKVSAINLTKKDGWLHAYPQVPWTVWVPEGEEFNRSELGYRYGTYTFHVTGFEYELQPEELALLQQKMDEQERKVILLSTDEVQRLEDYEIKPSSRELFRVYLEAQQNT